jgi:hypothetical protein
MSRWLSGIRLPLARPMGVLSAHPRAKTRTRASRLPNAPRRSDRSAWTLRLRDISLLPASSDLLRLLRSAFSVGATDIVEVRLSGNTTKGVFIKDVLPYRL